jgi:hypothetical protein
VKCDADCLSRWWITILGFVALIPSFAFAIVLSTQIPLEVSTYQPPEANLEDHTKLLGDVSVAIPILSGVAVIIILTFRIAAEEPCRFYDLVMAVFVVAIGAFLLGIGGDIFRVKSNIDDFIKPYASLWLSPASPRAAEIQEDFQCCRFQSGFPPSGLQCDESLPFCRDAIADAYDRDVIDLGIAALVFGGIDAIVAVIWLVVAIRKLVSPDYQVGGDGEPAQEADDNDSPAATGTPDPESPSPLCPVGEETGRDPEDDELPPEDDEP